MAAYDPAMAALDEAPRPRSIGAVAGTKRRKRKTAPKKATPTVQNAEFDLGTLDEDVATAPVGDQGSGNTHRSGVRRRRMDRARRTSRREIIGAVAITATVMFIVVMLGLSGSCSAASSSL